MCPSCPCWLTRCSDPSAVYSTMSISSSMPTSCMVNSTMCTSTQHQQQHTKIYSLTTGSLYTLPSSLMNLLTISKISKTMAKKSLLRVTKLFYKLNILACRNYPLPERISSL